MLKSNPFEKFQDTLPVFMKNSVIHLGLDPEFHSVKLKPHKLFIFDSQNGEKHYKMKFDNQPTGTIKLCV